MKKQKTQSKIIVALTAVVILLVAVSATLTFAYFTANSAAQSSQMTFGNLSLTIDNGIENDDSLVTTKCQHELVPGCTISTDGNLTITTNIDTIVRFRYVIMAAINVQGATTTSTQATDAIKALFTVSNTNETYQYTAGSAGAAATSVSNVITAYTAYQYVFVEASSQLEDTKIFDFDRVSFAIPTSWGNDYQGATLTLVAEVEAIQADHLTDGTHDITVDNTGSVINNVISNLEAQTPVYGVEDATAWATVSTNGVIATP